MSKINDGGPAFPRNGDFAAICNDGMSLRDYFAINAPDQKVEFPSFEMAARFAGIPTPDEDDVDAVIRLSAVVGAKLSYLYADAMLAERDRQS